MNDALRLTIALVIGYAIGAVHLWAVGKVAEGRAYVRGRREGFEQGRGVSVKAWKC